jgi:hypothetical protein
MTTFTTEDRIHAEKDGSLTVNVNAGEVTVNKGLTDEEIRALWNPMPDTKVYVRDLIKFARAILKKASEK